MSKCHFTPRRFTPHLLTTSALVLLLGQSFPAVADTTDPSLNAVPAFSSSVQPTGQEAAPSHQATPNHQAATSHNDKVTTTAAESTLTPNAGSQPTTIQVQLSPGEEVRIKTLPEGTVVIDTVPQGQNATASYRKNWCVSSFSSLLQAALPVKPDNFDQRPLLGVVNVTANQTNYNKAIKICDEKLSAEPSLLLKRPEVLSTRVNNKLSYNEQQQLLALPQITLISRYAPTFFSTRNVLVLQPKTNDCYMGYLVDLSTLNVRILKADNTKDAVKAHTELVQHAWELCNNASAMSELSQPVAPAPTTIALENNPGDDLNDNTTESELVVGTSAPKPLPNASAESAPNDATAQPTPGEPTHTMTMPDFSKVSTRTRRSRHVSADSLPAVQADNANRALTDGDASNDQADGAMSMPDFSRTWRTRNHPEVSAFAEYEQDMPLVHRHVYDPCFDDVYLRLLAANGISKDEYPAYLIAYNDICAFPYYSKGPLYVTTGLYRQLSNPDELAAALARELAQILLGYVDDRRTNFYDFPDRPWVLSKRTIQLLDEARALRGAISVAEMIFLNHGHFRPYWFLPSYIAPYYEDISDHMYFNLQKKQITQVDRLAATMCYVAGFSPESYASYMDKITKFSSRYEYPNGDLNMWLLSTTVDKEQADDIVADADKLNEFNRQILDLQRRDPALAQALRAHSAMYLKTPEVVQQYIQDYSKIIPLE